MENKKILNKFGKLSNNLKKFIEDNDLWVYCSACQENECYEYNPYTLKVLSEYILENKGNKEYIFVALVKLYSDTDEVFIFGNKNEIEKKIDEFITQGLCVRSESFFRIYNLIKDKEASWEPKIVD